jgi:flagellar basal body-associated protein FliL
LLSFIKTESRRIVALVVLLVVLIVVSVALSAVLAWLSDKTAAAASGNGASQGSEVAEEQYTGTDALPVSKFKIGE